MNPFRSIANAKHNLESIKGKTLSIHQRKKAAIELAALMLTEAKKCQIPSEKYTEAMIGRLLNDRSGKAFTISMTDQCFRCKSPERVASQLVYLIGQFGIPRFISLKKKMQLAFFRFAGIPLANFFVPFVKRMLRQETRSIILSGTPEDVSRYFQLRRKEKVRINLNHLGEAILGEEEAKDRLNTYLTDIANPEIEYLSVKISTIASQLNLLGWEETLNILTCRLKRLYRAAKEHVYVSPNGEKRCKFINLDMEEYRDLHLTVELFRRVLDEPEFFEYSAGIVLQSYLPDAFLIQQELTTWAMKREKNGGAPIKIRLVKGANLAMEKVEASGKGWPQAPYLSKAEVDANFKRMLNYGCETEHAKAVHLGIGSHNLFDIAYALILRAEKNVEKYAVFEMLEGMADHIRRVVQEIANDMLLYTPEAPTEDFQTAVAYLIRRLDENTAPDNFLRHAFQMLPDTKEWQSQAVLFSDACEAASTVGCLPRRGQDRFNQPILGDLSSPFNNDPDTDWSLPRNRQWAESLIKDWSEKRFQTIPLVVGGKEIIGENRAVGEDPSFPGKEFYGYILAGTSHLETALHTAVNSFKSWSEKPLSDRISLIGAVANELRLNRRDLIGAMVADAGKTVEEADAEVSEAIDFAEYYLRNIEEIHFLDDIQWEAKGTVLVAPPWNFPCSIAAGGMIAALITGNSVIFKPAPETVLVGWYLVNVFWKAGIGKDVLQFFTCQDEPIGSQLILDPRISAIALTGATATAKYLLKLRPGLDLMAETGGKNSMIITNMADRDLAIRCLIQSAFGHAGQKCSACSLAILESEVYDDPQFRKRLRDAASSLHVGTPWNLSNRVNPLIRPPNPILLKGLTTLENGEEWLLEPKQDPLNPRIWSPGIKIGIKQGSFAHQTEFFGPLLGLMRAESLAHAITLANATPYGLTAGIHTLDQREQEEWIQDIQAGNCYINRGITGAIVRRQPFGGIKESSFGPGGKSGGPNYVMQFMLPKQMNLPADREPHFGAASLLNDFICHSNMSEADKKLWDASLGSYSFFWNHYFSRKHDPSCILGQDNLLFYVPRSLVLRIQKNDRAIDIFRAIAAALLCDGSVELSFSGWEIESDLLQDLNGHWRKHVANIASIDETENEFIERIGSRKIRRLRLLTSPSPALRNAIAESACNATIASVLANGRLELLRFLNEVSLSIDYHRYGNLGVREGEERQAELEEFPKMSCESCACAGSCKNN